jgi:hypothetical protein
MPVDWTYLNGDRVMLSSGRYETTAGCWPKVLREMSAAYCTINGEPYGNRALATIDRASLADSDLETIRKGYEEVGLRYQRAGMIRDLEVEAERGPEASSMALRVSFWDIVAGEQVSTTYPAAWLEE